MRFRPFLLSGACASGLIATFVPKALAEFTGENRSINGTGETLPDGDFELGMTSASYGLSQDLMLQAPSLATLFGFGRIELRRRFRLEGDQRLTSYVFGETPKKFGIGSDYGWNFGSDHSHSLTAGGRVQFTRRLEGTSSGRRSRLHTIAIPNFEYDFYSNGNDSYLGIADYIPYVGHTWSFSFWNIGLIATPLTSMVPLPYVYVRF